MGDLLIRGIPEPLKREIERAASKGGQSLSAKAIDLLRKGIITEKQVKPQPVPSAWDSVRSVFVSQGAIDDEYWKIMEEIEAERKRDFGRPVDFGHPDDDSQ